MINTSSKLPNVGTTIFTVMSKLANDHNAINLSQGFPNFDCDTDLKNRINFHLQNGKNQYAPMSGQPELRKQLAKKIDYLYDAEVSADTEITITAGATQAIFTAITAFVKTGDEVIIVEPAYDSYIPSIKLAGGIPVVYELKAPDFGINWSAFGALICSKTRMIIINSPHNPTGTVLNKEDMLTLQSLVKDTNILILSDEVYEHLIYDGKQHESVLLYPELYKRSLAIYSFGKTFHSTGWKIGYCVAPEYLMKEFRKVHQFNVFSVNSFVQCALADYLVDPKNYITLPDFYQEKRDYLQSLMQQTKLKALPSSGTYFQLYDYSAVSDLTELEFAKELTIKYGVAVIPVAAFYSNKREQKVIRVCFAKTKELLQQAGEHLQKL